MHCEIWPGRWNNGWMVDALHACNSTMTRRNGMETDTSGSAGMADNNGNHRHWHQSKNSCCGSGRHHSGNRDDAWWEERSLAAKIVMGIGFGILGIAFIALIGWVVMSLWNWLMPDIFGLKQINYWQSWGLMILSFILFQGFGSGGGGRSDKRRKRHLRRYVEDEIGKEIDKEIDKEIKKELNKEQSGNTEG